MDIKQLVLVAGTFIIAGCSTTEKFQYLWHKQGTSAQQARETSLQCGNRIGENTVSTPQRQVTFHQCMRDHGYHLRRVRKN